MGKDKSAQGDSVTGKGELRGIEAGVPSHEEFADHTEHGFKALMERTQRAYAERDLEIYLSAWSDSYKSFQIGREGVEDIEGLKRKLEREFESYSLAGMRFSIERLEVMGSVGIAVLEYETELDKGEERLVDKRRNIIIGRYDGYRWRLVSKIVIFANTRAIPQE